MIKELVIKEPTPHTTPEGSPAKTKKVNWKDCFKEEHIKTISKTLNAYYYEVLLVIENINTNGIDQGNREYYEDKIKQAKKLYPQEKVIAEKQIRPLLNYEIYLKIMIGHTSSNLVNELKTIETLLKWTFTRVTDSPTPSDDMKEKKGIPPTFCVARKTFGFWVKMKGELDSLIKRFRFIEKDYPENQFALAYRQVEACIFLKKFEELKKPDECFSKSKKDKDDWDAEIIELNKSTIELYNNIQSIIKENSFFTQSGVNSKLKEEIDFCAEEFKINLDSKMLPSEIDTIKKLNNSIQKLKAIVEFENNFECYRKEEVREMLHTDMSNQLDRLKKKIDEKDTHNRYLIDERAIIIKLNDLSEKNRVKKESFEIIYQQIVELYGKTIEPKYSKTSSSF